MLFIVFQKLYHLFSKLPALQPCNWVGFRISLSLSREGAILIFQDENEITYCCSLVSRLMKIITHGRARKNETDSHENFRGGEFSLNSDLSCEETNTNAFDAFEE